MLAMTRTEVSPRHLHTIVRCQIIQNNYQVCQFKTTIKYANGYERKNLTLSQIRDKNPSQDVSIRVKGKIHLHTARIEFSITNMKKRIGECLGYMSRQIDIKPSAPKHVPSFG